MTRPKPRSPWYLITILVAAAFSGCQADGSVIVPNEPASTAPATAAAPTPQPHLGALEVLVIDDESLPIGAAQVAIAGREGTALTGDDGRAVFNDLAPAQYAVIAGKPGYEPRDPAGRTVHVAEGEVASVTLILRAAFLVNPAHAYHFVFPMRGFIACDLSYLLEGALMPTYHCLRDYSASGNQPLRDPKENSTHPWLLDNMFVRAFAVESVWQRTIGAAPSDLLFVVARKVRTDIGCDFTCWEGFDSSRQGKSPIRWFVWEGDANNITKKHGPKPEAYPSNLVLYVRAAQATTASPVHVVYQQSYDAFVTTFYGLDPDPNYTALPS